ncbi:ATP-binding protein [Pararhodospirillum oryzae]|uniref:Histidine kinase/HSP90-like ATPase domain-containing protein n=1 Tax=Pararhodospirillum oryzae TaxID=478448 RepID=A0A512HA14_9PROT|nr:ATP-binding protein [Pararhodospirillum oryzae]GEO82304.1 hypothetical protein ROR02_24350 [Pararhodospirillum oryzae]
MMATGDVVVLRVDAAAAQRRPLLDAVEAFCRQVGGDDRILGQVLVVVDEVFTNIISYAHDQNEGHGVDVEMTEIMPGKISIRISDDGRAFNPIDRPAVDTGLALEDRKVGGLGIHFLKTFMDSYAYERHGNTNHLTVTKQLWVPADRDKEGAV